MIEKIVNNKNILISGEIASGKTRNVLFPVVDELINNKESMFIIDSKEEYVNNYYNKLKDNGYNVHLVDLRNIKNSESWNPLLYPYQLYKEGNRDLALETLDKISKAIFYEESQQDPFWCQSASDFFTGCVLGLFEDANEDEINFNSVARMFESVGTSLVTDYTKKYFNLKEAGSSAYIYASNTINAPTDTKGGIISVARMKLRLYTSRESLSKLMSKSSFSYDEVLDKPTAIIFVGKEESKYTNVLIAMFVEQLFSYMMNNRLNNRLNNRFNYILDSIDIIEKIDTLPDMLGSGLSKNMKFYIATRSYDEFINKYGSYVINLVNKVDVKTNTIEVTMNGETVIEDKKETTIKLDDTNIELPVLDESDIKVFDVVGYVTEHTPNPLNIENPGDLNIDDLIQKIDDKIAEIDKEETSKDK